MAALSGLRSPPQAGVNAEQTAAGSPAAVEVSLLLLTCLPLLAIYSAVS